MNHLKQISLCNETDNCINYTVESPNLATAIKRAFLSENKSGKLNSHQNRVGRKKLKEAYDLFIQEDVNFLQISSFEEIFKTILNHRPKGFGLLGVYDVSLRISHYLNTKENINCLPTRVYLVGSGPRKNFRNLFPNDIIPLAVAPEKFENRDSSFIGLQPWEMEIKICHYPEN